MIQASAWASELSCWFERTVCAWVDFTYKQICIQVSNRHVIDSNDSNIPNPANFLKGYDHFHSEVDDSLDSKILAADLLVLFPKIRSFR